MAGWRPPFSLRRALPALNVASATPGGLLVVSELGEGITGSPSQQPTVSVINQAQASESAQPLTSPRPPSQDGTDRTAGTNGTGGTSGTGGTGGAGGAGANGGTVLTSSGGTVVARCATAGAFLLSWSPQQGFQAGSVIRGPASAARVVFTTTASTVTMTVSCSSGVPSAATTVTNAEVEDNGGRGGGGNSGPGGGGGGGGRGRQDRIPPRVQLDDLGQQFGTQPMPRAGDRVDAQPVPHVQSHSRSSSLGIGSSGARPTP